jgi:hypothetical protein
LHSFYDFSYVLKLPVKHITRLAQKAGEKKEENKVWEIWISKFPHMNEENFVSFNEYYAKLKTKPMQRNQPSDETVEDIFNRLKSKIKKQ